MRLKTVFALVGLALPVVYCGGLYFYFLSFGGSVQAAVAVGLGPTMLGLGAIGLLFFIPLVLKSIRILTAPRKPAPDGKPIADEEGSFDPDAALARYMARRSAEGHAPPTPLPPPQAGGAAQRPTFGRKIA